MTEGNHWRCKACGYIMSTNEYEYTGGFCRECRNE